MATSAQKTKAEGSELMAVKPFESYLPKPCCEQHDTLSITKNLNKLLKHNDWRHTKQWFYLLLEGLDRYIRPQYNLEYHLIMARWKQRIKANINQFKTPPTDQEIRYIIDSAATIDFKARIISCILEPFRKLPEDPLSQFVTTHINWLKQHNRLSGAVYEKFFNSDASVRRKRARI